MEIDIKFYLGIIAGIISLIAYLIYFRSILKGKSKPNRVTWWIWTFMGAALALSYYFSGARDTMWSPIVEFIGPFLTALLAIKYGEGGAADKTDIICFVGGVFSIVLWILFNNPVIALVMLLVVDSFAIIPTMKKSYLRPEGESLLAWCGTGLGDMINLLSVERFAFALIILPAWMLFDDIIVVWMLGLGKQKVKVKLVAKDTK
jgi:hypothetical protein